MIKILCIGNSFSQDATAYMEMFSKEVFVRNLYIGGCSLETHCSLLENEESEYAYQQNGQSVLAKKVSLKQALNFEEWDYITVQQASGFSGIKESYYPYIDQLIKYVKKYSNAKIVFHQTWAYEKNSDHSAFVNYNGSSAEMEKLINQATAYVCAKENLSVIPCGELIAKLKTHDYFDIEKGGVSLHRDGYHLSYNFGRIAAAGVWLKFFTNKIPEYLYRENLIEGYKIILKELEDLKI